MSRVLIALRAELVHFDAIGVVTPILLGDVVAVLAVSACERDLRTDIGRLGHGVVPLLSPDVGEDLRLVVCTEPGDSMRSFRFTSLRIAGRAGTAFVRAVAEAGLEPATQRL